MKKILIIGAHGKIGQILTKKLADSGKYQPTAFIRKEEQKKVFDKMKVPVLIGDLEDTVINLTSLFDGFDVIIFTAGSGGSTGSDMTLAIDLDGAVRTMEAAEAANVSRYIIVSASHSDDRDFWDKAEGMKPYYIAKHYADEMLRNTNLEYTILRPVMLTDDDGTGKITASLNPDEVSKKIPREDVASVIMQAIAMEGTFGQTIELSSGEENIAKALDGILAANHAL